MLDLTYETNRPLDYLAELAAELWRRFDAAELRERIIDADTATERDAARLELEQRQLTAVS